MPLSVELVSKEKRVFQIDDVEMVLIPAAEGEMGVLPNHAPVLTTLGQGELVIRKQGREERFVVYGGVVDVRPNKVTVLAELAVSSFDVDIEAIEKAREHALKLMKEGGEQDQNRAAALTLRQAELQLQVSRKIRQRGSQVMRILEPEIGK